MEKALKLDVWLDREIRQADNKGIMSGWLYEWRLDIVPLFRQTLRHIIDGGSLILLTDAQHEWLGSYITQHINPPNKTRPFFPVYELSSLGFMIDKSLRDSEDKAFSMIINMLNLSFKKYSFWYIGRRNPRAEFVLLQNYSFVWLIDENLPKTFNFSSSDELIDYKLLQMYRLFENALCASVFGQISLEF